MTRGQPRDPTRWWEQVQTDMKALEIRIYEATMQYLAARSPAVRLDRLVILQSLERSALYGMRRHFNAALAYGELAPEDWLDKAEEVRQLYLLMYRRRLQQLEEHWAAEQKAGAKSNLYNPVYQLLNNTRLKIKRLEQE